MFKNDFSDFPAVSGGQIVFKLGRDVKRFGEEPVFAIRFAFLAVDVNRFVTFVGVEKESPAKDFEDGGHGGSAFGADKGEEPLRGG